MTPAGDKHPLIGTVSAPDEHLGIEHTLDASGAESAHLLTLPRCHDGHGGVAAGVLMMLADVILARASLRQLRHDQLIVTSNLHIDIIAPLSTVHGPIGASAVTVDHVDDGAVHCHCQLMDARGVLIATTSGRFAVLESDNRAAAQVSNATNTQPLPAAHTRPPHTPLRELLDPRIGQIGERSVQLEFPASDRWANDRGGVHGGVGALIGEQAGGIALHSVAPASSAMRPYDVRALFFRPIPASGQLMRCTAEVVHVGRSLAATRSLLFTAEGRIAVVVDVLYAPSASVRENGVHNI
jgi:uncharacterized protein (TIGR00369 family)